MWTLFSWAVTDGGSKVWGSVKEGEFLDHELLSATQSGLRFMDSPVLKNWKTLGLLLNIF
jgi:hypothetical protein